MNLMTFSNNCGNNNPARAPSGRGKPRWIFRALLGVLLLSGAAGPVPRPAVRTGTVANQPALIVQLRGVASPVLVRLDSDTNLAAALYAHERRPEVAAVEVNTAVRAAAFPNDPNFPAQWYLAAIEARDAWSAELLQREGRQTKTPVIAVLDTGVDIDHPDLQGKLWVNPGERPGDGIDNDRNGFVDDWQGWDFLTNTPDPRPKFDSPFRPEAMHHGTIVAGLAAAASHNGMGITGVSWKALVMPLRVLDAEGNGTVFHVLKAVEYAKAQRVDVLNLSFVGVDFSQQLRDALKSAADAGIVVVAAAGNANNDQPGANLNLKPAYPVCLDAGTGDNFILGVAALNRQRQLPAFSNYGSRCVDISAPGVGIFGILTTSPTRPDFRQSYGGSWSGTSVAVPLVSGAAAIVRSLRPELSAPAVGAIILESVDPVTATDPERAGGFGQGQINLRQVVENALAYRGPSGRRPGSVEALLATGLGFGSFPQIKVFSARFDALKSWFAYAPSFGSSVSVAGGDLDGDRNPELVSGAGVGGGPHVRVFNLEGQVQAQWFAFDRRLRHGVNVAVGKFAPHGGAALIAAAPAGGGPPEVVVFNGAGQVVGRFFAYDKTFRGGVNLAAGDLDGDGVDEIITGTGTGGGPHVRVFDLRGKLLAQFFPFNPVSRFGVTVAAGDLDGDGRDEIVAAVASGGEPRVLLFNAQGAPMGEFLAHDARYRGGVRPAFLSRPAAAP